MLDRLRNLWAERPAVIAAAVIAPITFLVTLFILFVVVGGGDDEEGQSASLAEANQSQAEQPDEQASRSSTQQTTVIVETSSSDEQQDSDSAATQPSASDEAQPTQDEAATQDDEQPSSDDESQSSEQDSDGSTVPEMVGGWVVQALDEVLEEEINLDELRHGTDGMEGGILPIDNGVVVSSLAEQRTSWELIVPSARLKSTIVEVGRTNSGAMGSPDNPYVVGWLNSSAAPGEEGNVLLAGHRDFEDKDGNVGTGVCWELVNTVEGDQMLVHDQERNIYFVYTVTEAATVNPSDPGAGRYLKNTDDPVITLITCEGSFNADTHQYSHRRVVVGVLAAVASPDA